ESNRGKIISHQLPDRDVCAVTHMDPTESTALCVAGNGFTTTRKKFVSSSSYDLILYIGSVTDMAPGVSEVVVLAAVVKVEDEERER
ncbi:hypothetical protein Tco_1097954, partial [Tanacetum coccineum]